MKPVEIEDIAEINCTGDLKISPDGIHAVFAVLHPDMENNGYERNLFLLDMETGAVRQLTYNGRNHFFLWEDNQTILIQRDDDASEKEKTSFYRLKVNGGEAFRAFEIDENVNEIYPLGNGLFACRILTDWNRPAKDADEKVIEEEKDYHIFEEVPYWGNGRGYVSGKRNALFLYDEKSNELTRITDRFTNVSSMHVQDHQILYISRTWKESMPLESGLHLYDVKEKKDTELIAQKELRIDMACFLKERIIFAASTMKPWGEGQLRHIYVMDANDSSCREIFSNDEEIAIGDGNLTDTFRFDGNTFLTADDKLYFEGMKGYGCSIYSLDWRGLLKKEVDFHDGCIGCFDTDGKYLAFTGSMPGGLNHIYIAQNGRIQDVYDANPDYFTERYNAVNEHLSFPSKDGAIIDGWVMKPMHYDPEKTYPGILEIHGGPRCAYGTVFYHEMQVFASMGCFVFYCNPHGSEGYGEKFADLRGKYGTIDYEDLMTFTDIVLEKYPQIDAKRLGACGGSYGGFMCNWIEGHTDRFSAIASQRSISNWLSDFGTSEIGFSFDQNEMNADPWKNPEIMWEKSPLKYANHARTPILFIHSLCDYNCTIDQGAEMFAAMKYFHVPSRMVVFEGENHGLSRSGRPKHRIRRLKEIADWFRKYLKIS